MREPKFRAWNPSVKRMTHFAPPQITGNWQDKMGMFFKAEDDVFLSSYSDPMQFTGLLDKNGREIYEGDVLKAVSGRSFPVAWSAIHTSFRAVSRQIYLDPVSWASSEIIGNIYENPELLATHSRPAPENGRRALRGMEGNDGPVQ